MYSSVSRALSIQIKYLSHVYMLLKNDTICDYKMISISSITKGLDYRLKPLSVNIVTIVILYLYPYMCTFMQILHVELNRILGAD